LLWGGASLASGQSTDQIRIVGIMRASSFERDDSSIQIMRRELESLGYTEGRDFRFEQLSARNQAERMAAVAQELVRRKVDVIVATTAAAAQAAKEATSTIPIVMIAYDRDPVTAGLVRSLARPGGNVTGLSSLQLNLIGKRLELLKEMLPALSKVAVVHDAATRRFPEGIDAAARAAGVRVQRIDVRWPEDIERAFRPASMNADAVMVLFSSMLHTNRARIAAAAVKAGMPTMCQELSFVEAGALMSYAPDRSAVLARVVYMIDRLFKGAKPSELPVEQAAKFVLAVNQGTAKKLGIAIPDSILLRADEVIR
jgi:putative ABC transport system substrate-binding protein